MNSWNSSPASAERGQVDFGHPEPDFPLEVAERSLSRLTATVALTLIGLVVCIGAVNEVMYYKLRDEVRSKQLAAPNPLLASVRAEEAERLTRYRWLRKRDGVVRIPLERAKQLVLADYARTAASASPGQAGATAPAASLSAATNKPTDTTFRQRSQ